MRNIFFIHSLCDKIKPNSKRLSNTEISKKVGLFAKLQQGRAYPPSFSRALYTFISPNCSMQIERISTQKFSASRKNFLTTTKKPFSPCRSTVGSAKAESESDTHTWAVMDSDHPPSSSCGDGDGGGSSSIPLPLPTLHAHNLGRSSDGGKSQHFSQLCMLLHACVKSKDL